jgi:orotate phosphoribosyltransferase
MKEEKKIALALDGYKSAAELKAAKGINENDSLQVLKDFEGYYKSRCDENKKFLGPLVAYAGTYKTEAGPKNYVGFEYFNFARIEEHPLVRTFFAKLIVTKIKSDSLKIDLVLGVPMGGLMLAASIGDELKTRTIFSEKKIISLANKEKGEKEVSEQILARHDIFIGDKVVVVEDVCNNFSTTEKIQALVEKVGGKLVGIVCAVNRSGKKEWKGIPVISAIYIPTEQYRQDDPEVIEFMAKNDIVWSPKLDWETLKKAMWE